MISRQLCHSSFTNNVILPNFFQVIESTRVQKLLSHTIADIVELSSFCPVCRNKMFMLERKTFYRISIFRSAGEILNFFSPSQAGLAGPLTQPSTDVVLVRRIKAPQKRTIHPAFEGENCARFSKTKRKEKPGSRKKTLGKMIQ